MDRRTLLAAGLALGLGGAARADPRPLVCAGGETLRPLLRAWAAAARGGGEPDLAVSVDADVALSADGVRRLIGGEADFVSMVREPFPSEVAAFRARFGRAPVLVPVARGSFATRGGTHAIAIYVNDANPIAGLSLPQLARSFGAASPVRTWGELGLAGEWAGRPLIAYGMTPRRASGDPPGVVNFFEQRVLGGGGFRTDLTVEVDQPGEQALAAIVRRVAGDAGGVGYSGFGYAAPGARAIPIAEHAGRFVAGSPASAADGTYPLARHVYVLADRPPRGLDPRLRAYLRFVLSAPGQAMIGADTEGFLPLTGAERRAALRQLG
jgi:phosphate transport system substrate-binding protein